MRVTYASPRFLMACLMALVELNAELYNARSNLHAPWSLIWVPDQLEVCDASGCRFADTSTLIDVVDLERIGAGSCGPLACAYAAYAATRARARDVSIELLPDVEDAWHVVAHANGRLLDPQVIGVHA
jgi:hypothetical protein